MPTEFVPIIFSVLEMISPRDSTVMFSEALNFRLGTKDLNVSQLAAESANRGMTL
jgi:hypothetical protein